MKAVAYIRVSTLDQKLSPAAQRKRITDLCAARDWKLCRVFSDKGRTGRNDDRPGLAKALDWACKHQAVIVTYSLSRLSRSAGDAEKICGRIQAAGASLASCTEPIDTTTAMGRAFFGIVTVFARLESELIGERVKAVNDDTKLRLGYRTQSSQPAGWKLDKEAGSPTKGERVPHEEERAVIRRLMELYEAGRAVAGEAARERLVLDRHASDVLHVDYSGICAKLRAERVPTIAAMRGWKRAHIWTPKLVRSYAKKQEKNRPAWLPLGREAAHAGALQSCSDLSGMSGDIGGSGLTGGRNEQDIVAIDVDEN